MRDCLVCNFGFSKGVYPVDTSFGGWLGNLQYEVEFRSRLLYFFCWLRCGSFDTDLYEEEEYFGMDFDFSIYAWRLFSILGASR